MVTTNILSNTANHINNLLYTYQPMDLARDEKQFLLQDVVWAMESRVDELDPTDCSRLTWLYVHLDQREYALQTARHGLRIDPDNEHCRKILERVSP